MSRHPARVSQVEGLPDDAPLSLQEAASIYGMPISVIRTAIDRHDVEFENLGGTLVMTKDYMNDLLQHPNIGVVYVVGFLKYIKIGFSQNFESRLDSLQSACPLKLTVYRKFPAFPSDERSFHRRFAHARLNGEWFYMDRKVSAWVRGAK
jgi:hypothetical protein